MTPLRGNLGVWQGGHCRGVTGGLGLIAPQGPLCCTWHPHHSKALEEYFKVVGSATAAGHVCFGSPDPVTQQGHPAAPPLSPSPTPSPSFPNPHPTLPPPPGTMGTTLHSGETTQLGWLHASGCWEGGQGGALQPKGAPSDPWGLSTQQPPSTPHTPQAPTLCGGAAGDVGVVAMAAPGGHKP